MTPYVDVSCFVRIIHLHDPSDHNVSIWIFFFNWLTSFTLDWAYHTSTTMRAPRGTLKPPEIPPRWLHSACPVVFIEPTASFSPSYSLELAYCISTIIRAPTETQKMPLSWTRQIAAI